MIPLSEQWNNSPWSSYHSLPVFQSLNSGAALVSLRFLFSSSLLLSTLFFQAQGVPVIQVETHLIDTTLSVRDADGRIVTGLTQDDFTVVEDGVPQKIRFFAHDNQLPLSIGLIIDASGSQEKFVKEHEKDIEAFLRQILEPSDQAFAVCFGNHLRLVSDSTSSAPAIMDGIRSFDKGNTDFPEIGPKEKRELGTALYDAVFYSVTEKLTSIRQRPKSSSSSATAKKTPANTTSSTRSKPRRTPTSSSTPSATPS